MPIPTRSRGPGKYDHACTLAREATDAHTCLVVIIGGNRGHGFSVQTLDTDSVEELPEILRIIADEIEDEIAHE